jgi:hypothetical protein
MLILLGMRLFEFCLPEGKGCIVFLVRGIFTFGRLPEVMAFFPMGITQGDRPG